MLNQKLRIVNQTWLPSTTPYILKSFLEKIKTIKMADLKAIAEQLVNLTVKDVNELATILKDDYGIEPAAAAVAVAAGPGGGGEAAAAEQTEFSVILTSAGAGKLKVVKEVKNLLGLGLKEAKELVDGAPCPVKEGIPKEEAESIKASLEGVGASIEVK
jgi:large subunit ribosomal protein L7/L12